PGLLAINRKFGVRAFIAKGKPVGRLFTENKWKAAQQEVADHLTLQWSPRAPLEGPVVVTIDTWWPRMNRAGPAEGMPLGDVDAAGKALLDSLAIAGVIGDDSQVLRLTQVKHSGPGRVEIRVGRP
ncbi:unnamed protein product, partial [marine sediment metagenome]